MANDNRIRAEIERVRGEAALRQSEERQAFLLALSDALRSLRSSGEIEREAARILGEHLGVAGAVIFAHLSAEGAEVVSEFQGGKTPSFLGHYSYREWSTAGESVRRGQTFVAGDVKTALITDQERERWLRYGICSAASVPIVRQGTAVASLTVCDTVARAWGAHEVGFLEDIADRTWTAVERARAEEACRQSEERYRLLVLASSEMVYRMSGDWSEMISLEGKSFLADTREASLAWLGEYIPDSEKPRVEAAVAEAIRGKTPFELEHRVILADGTVGWVFSRAIPFVDENDRIVEWFGAASDVTSRKRAETNLAFLAEASQDLARLSSIAEAMETLGARIGAFLDVPLIAFGEVDEAQEVVTVAHGWNRADLPSLKGVYRIRDFHTEDFRQACRAGETYVVRDAATDERADTAAMAALGIASFVSVPLLRQGHWLFQLTLLDTRPRHWRADEIELIRELTGRIWTRLERAAAEAALVASEQALRESEARLASVFTALPVGVGLVDTEGRLVLGNRKLHDYLPTGVIPSRDLSGPVRWRAWHPDGSPVEREDFPGARALRGETVVPGLELLHTQPDGKEVWTQVAAVPHRDEQGKILGQITVVTDIDALKRAQEALREADRRRGELPAKPRGET